MIVTITLSQLIECRRVAAGLNFSRQDCSVELVEGIGIEDRWAQQMRRRYARLLRAADPMLLPVSDIASEITLDVSRAGEGTAALPATAARLLNIRLRSWKRPARVVTRAEYDADGSSARALNPFCAPGADSPAAILEPSGEVTLLPASAPDSVAHAIAVTDPGPDLFTLDESLIESLIAP